MAIESKPERGKIWVGQPILRKEDRRHLAGASTFVADIRLPHMRDVAFVRSPVAHGRILTVEKPEGLEASVFTLEDIQPLVPVSGGPEMATFRDVPYPPLADGKVFFVGQTLAMCIGTSRAAAEDMAGEVMVDFEEIEPVVDALDAMTAEAPVLHDGWPDNSFISALIEEGDIGSVSDAPVRIRRQLKMNRQATNSLETRGVVAYRDHRLDELVVYSSTQGPHVMRHGLALALGLPEQRIRVVAPDVGGGFGGKNRLMPEEIAVAALAMKVDHPVRWIEDRNEHLIASTNAREHFYDLTLLATEEGRVLGIEGSVHVDAGAFALWPSGPFMETGMAARNLPGSYQVEHLRIDTHTVATNKAPIGPYRGVARPGACFAIERMIDELADHLGVCPVELRHRNLVQPEMMPYRTAGGLRLDNGDYPEALRRAVGMLDMPALRERQEKGEPDGRRLGVGFAVYTEQSGHGTSEWVKRKSRVVPGFESATVRMLPDGTVTLLVGIQSHGQGLETSLAQIAAEEMGLDPSIIQVRHGDTGLSPQGFGTFASRSIVFSGGAVAKASRALAGKIRSIGAHLLQTTADAVEIREGRVVGDAGEVDVAEVARTANIRPENLPDGTAPGLEVTETYEPPESGGVFSYGVHAVTLLAHPVTGETEIIDYVIVEDCGNLINPMIVDGQIIGGVAQGIGTALFEELSLDENGQPTATTFGDYMMPCAPEIPAFRIAHMITPAESTEFGVKGMGEGGAIAPPAAVANAMNDAFRYCGASFVETPLTPRRVSDAVAAALDEEGSR